MQILQGHESWRSWIHVGMGVARVALGVAGAHHDVDSLEHPTLALRLSLGNSGKVIRSELFETVLEVSDDVEVLLGKDFASKFPNFRLQTLRNLLPSLVNS